MIGKLIMFLCSCSENGIHEFAIIHFETVLHFTSTDYIIHPIILRKTAPTNIAHLENISWILNSISVTNYRIVENFSFFSLRIKIDDSITNKSAFPFSSSRCFHTHRKIRISTDVIIISSNLIDIPFPNICIHVQNTPWWYWSSHNFCKRNIKEIHISQFNSWSNYFIFFFFIFLSPVGNRTTKLRQQNYWRWRRMRLRYKRRMWNWSMLR